MRRESPSGVAAPVEIENEIVVGYSLTTRLLAYFPSQACVRLTLIAET